MASSPKQSWVPSSDGMESQRSKIWKGRCLHGHVRLDGTGTSWQLLNLEKELVSIFALGWIIDIWINSPTSSVKGNRILFRSAFSDHIHWFMSPASLSCPLVLSVFCIQYQAHFVQHAECCSNHSWVLQMCFTFPSWWNSIERMLAFKKNPLPGSKRMQTCRHIVFRCVARIYPAVTCRVPIYLPVKDQVLTTILGGKRFLCVHKRFLLCLPPSLTPIWTLVLFKTWSWSIYFFINKQNLSN